MKFEWDEAKNQGNISKHGISFEIASRIFNDHRVTVIDNRIDYGEVRELSIGKIDDILIVVVVHTQRDGAIRIISARRANRAERHLYEQKIQSNK